MNKLKYNELQFNALREEIMLYKKRKFRMLTFGILVLPYVQSVFFQQQNTSFMLPFIPIFVLVFAASFIKNHNNIMRCGAYIRFHIEEDIERKHPEFTGWETWADKYGPLGRKYIDYISVACSLVLFLAYYLFSIVLAYISGFNFVDSKPLLLAHKVLIVNFCLSLYVLLGFLFGWFIYRYTRLSTDRRHCKADDHDPNHRVENNAYRRKSDGIAVDENMAHMIGIMS